MARLDLRTRTRIGKLLEQQLPNHWKVIVGDKGYAYIEADQDGKKPPHEYPAVGSVVFLVENVEGHAVAYRFDRIPASPGYVESRKLHSTIAVESGRGWVERLVNALVTAAAEADASMTTILAEA